jgi:hypothetical protein
MCTRRTGKWMQEIQAREVKRKAKGLKKTGKGK